MKIVIEWMVVLLVLFLTAWPYIGYYRDNKTLNNSLIDNGAGYIEVFLRAARDRFIEVVGTVILVILLSLWSVLIAAACIGFLAAIAYAAAMALRQGYVPSKLVDE